MTNDTTTLNGALKQLGETMATNLQSMGVSNIDDEDGLTTLANAILDIEPSVGGLNLETNLSIHVSSNNVGTGESITITSILSVSYDDTTASNVDLNGVLTGATVKLKNGNTIIGTGVTDNNGEVTFTYTPQIPEILTLTTSFDRTNNFDSCHSNSVNVTASIVLYNEITWVDNSHIVSYYNNDSVVLTAKLQKNSNDISIDDISLDIYKNGVYYDTYDTVNGIISFTYNSLGDGDVSFTITDGNITSSSYDIEDCLYYHENEVSYVSNYSSGDHSIRLDSNLSIPITSDFELSMDCKATMNGARFQLSSISGASSSTTNYGFGFNRESQISIYYRDTSSKAFTSGISYDTNYHNIKVVRDGDTFTGYLDNNITGTQTFTWWNSKSPFSFYWWVWRTGTIYAKNIKVKKI